MLVTVNASDIKSLFADVKPICKSLDVRALMLFQVHNDVLTIEVKSAILYQKQIAVAERGPYTITVVHQDISELLPTRGSVQIELEPTYICIRADAMLVTLHQANSILSEYKSHDGRTESLEYDTLSSVISVLAETAPVAKTLKRAQPVIFGEDFSIIKFPTFWLQTCSVGITGILGLDDMVAVSKYAPSRFYCSDSVVEFYKGTSVMALANSKVTQVKTIPDMCKGMVQLGAVEGGHYLPKIQQLLRSVGAGSCTLLLYTDGVQISVSRYDVHTSVKVGACTKHLVSVDTFLEYAQMFWKIIGTEAIAVRKGENAICITTQTLMMLLATL